MTATKPSTPRERRKAVLVCPHCGHESAVDGDWAVSERRGEPVPELEYACPACGGTVERRRVFGPILA